MVPAVGGDVFAPVVLRTVISGATEPAGVGTATYDSVVAPEAETAEKRQVQHLAC